MMATVASTSETDPLLLQNICRYTSECSPLPTVAAEGLSHIMLYVNAAFCLMIGKPQEELIGHPFAETVPEEEEDKCIPLLDRVYSTGNAETLAEQAHFHTTPSPSYWSYSVWAVLDPTDHPRGVMIQMVDRTETVLSRQQIITMNEALLLSNVRLDELREQAEVLSRKLQRSLVETHHRIKNNLQVLSALAQIQINEEDVTVPVSALQRIVTYAHALADLHDLLTQQAKVDGEGKMVNTQTSLMRLLSLLQTSVGGRPFHSDIASAMLSIKQSSSLYLIVSELVSNAYKHGTGAITVRLVRDGEAVQLSVEDTGAGFPPDFDPHGAAHTGLDILMSLTQHDLHGTIQFTNNPAGGGCVLVTFPL